MALDGIEVIEKSDIAYNSLQMNSLMKTFFIIKKKLMKCFLIYFYFIDKIFLHYQFLQNMSIKT